MESTLIYLALGFYLVATLAYLCPLVIKEGFISRLASASTLAGFGTHSLALLTRIYHAGHPPLSNLYESLSVFAWAFVLIYLFIEFRYRNKGIGSFIMPIVLLALGTAAALPKTFQELMPRLQGFWLYLHVGLVLIGNAALVFASLAAFMYLLQERQLKSKTPGAFSRRLPSLDLLDRLGFRSLSIGFPLFTLGLITGTIWAGYAWGTYWAWDPKETSGLMTWVIYAALLHARLSFGWRGRKAAVLSLIGFGAIVFAFLGVSLSEQG